MKNELSPNDRLVSEAGGTLSYVSEDGELLAAIDVPAGVQYVTEYLELCPDGASVELSDGLVALKPRSRCTVQEYGPGATDSGANPDFQPTSARRMELDMRMTLNKMKASSKRLEARENALANIERIPKAPDPEPVVEPVEPVPAPAPAVAK